MAPDPERKLESIERVITFGVRGDVCESCPFLTRVEVSARNDLAAVLDLPLQDGLAKMAQFWLHPRIQNAHGHAIVRVGLLPIQRHGLAALAQCADFRHVQSSS